MSSLFTELSEGLLDFSDGQLIEEAAYPDMIPYNKAVRRVLFLPKGTASETGIGSAGRGILCFPYTKSVDETIQLINHPSNFSNGNKYKLYYYNRYYRGKIYTTRYRYNDTQLRKKIYEKVSNETTLRCMKEFPRNDAASLNMYVEMSRFLTIFETATKKIQPMRYIRLYWQFLSNAIQEINPSGYRMKIILCDLGKYPLTGILKQDLHNPLYLIYYTLFRKEVELMKSFDIDFYFFSNKTVLKINPAQLTKEHYPLIKAEMAKMMRTVSTAKSMSVATDEKELLKADVKAEELEKIAKVTEPDEVLLTNTKETEPVIEPIPNKAIENDIDKKVSNIVDHVANKIPKEIVLTTPEGEQKDHHLNATIADDTAVKQAVQKQAREEIDKDRELIEKIYRQSLKKEAKKSVASSARDEKLREAEKDLKIKGTTISDLEKINAANTTIPTKDISNALTTTNENMKLIRFNNFEKEYHKVLLKKDIADAILALNNKSIPMFILDIQVEDSSNELNYKDTYTIKLEDANRKRHTIKVDIPKFLEDRFLYLGGNKKRIKYQNFFYPIVKIKPNTVLVVTNYNKMTIERVSAARSLSYVSRLTTLISMQPEIADRFQVGNVSINNRNYITTLEYDELAKCLISYKQGSRFDTGTFFFFDQGDAESFRIKHNIDLPENMLFLGTKKGQPIFIDIDSQKTKDDETILDLIIAALGEDYAEIYGKIRPPKRAIYAKVTVMEKAVSVGLLLGLWEGITSVMKKLNIKSRLEDKIPSNLSPHESFIKFNDCVLVYEDTVPVSLIMNGFRLLETAKWSIIDFDKSEPYLQYIIKVYGKAAIENALYNVYEFMIDPITKSILEDLNQPTDIVSVLIYAVKLLSDSQYTTELNQGLNRVRSSEIIPAILYDKLAKAYIGYRNSNGRQKFSIKQDAVITELMAQKTVEDYSVLNPMVEMQQTSAISTKGYKGVNLDESYTIPKRSYDKSMIGTIAAVTPPDGQCGVTRYLTMEPQITNLRGYTKATDDADLKDLKDVNLFTGSDMTIPLAGTLDDPNRLGHALKQNSHVVPVAKSSPVLISNGVEERVRFMVGSDFAINAEEDGQIIDYDEDSQIMIAKYKSGKCQAINLAPVMAKNGGGGFWMSNKMVTSLKVGDKFKKNDVLASHEKFFSHSKYNNAKLNMGTLSKVALTSTHDTYEDSTMITKKLSEDASTEMCFLKSAVIGKNANVTYLAQKGDHVAVGDMLAQFDTSYEDESVNQLLAALGDEDRESILSQSRNEIRSKYSGVIEEIKIYSTVELDELSPSLKKIVSAYYRKIDKKKQFLNQYDPDNKDGIVKCGMLVTETTKKIEPNKFGVIKGEQAVDSVLIEFYIKHAEPLEIGSKLAMFTALKNTIHDIIPEGYEGWSEYHPDEEIGSIVASNSVLNRMVPSITLNMLGNKCIVELKRKLQEIYES